MTLDELLECNADTLQKMSDEELVKYFEPYFNVTRPERITRATPSTPSVSPEMQQKLKLLASLGIDVKLGKKKK